LLEDNSLFPIAASLFPFAGMSAIRREENTVSLACGSGGAGWSNHALGAIGGTFALAKSLRAFSCGSSRSLVQMKNTVNFPDEEREIPKGGCNRFDLSIAAAGARILPIAMAKPLKRPKMAMGGSCKKLPWIWGGRPIRLGSAPQGHRMLA
jgi:hypothetical protein